MESIESRRKNQTKSARQVRWRDSTEQRQEARVEKTILFIARLGWATTALVNYYLGLTSQAWPKELEKQGLLYRQRIIIGNQTKSRTKANGRLTTILLLTGAGQRLARELDPRLGKRIVMPSMTQARHDLISFWVATHAVKEKWEWMEMVWDLEIWGDQVLRTFIHNADVRPDAAVILTDDDSKRNYLLHVEVERSKKKTGLEEYKFMRKLAKYSSVPENDTVIVCETQGRADAIIELLTRAQTNGITPYYYNEHAKTWWPLEYGDPEQFQCRAIVAVWDQERTTFTGAHYNNC